MRTVFSVFLLLICTFTVFAKTVKIKMLAAFTVQEQMAVANTTYNINFRIDLQGDTLRLPLNSTLDFKDNGVICNGTIIGAHSSVKAPKRVVFEDMVIAGSWENKEVYSEWVDFPIDSLSCNKSFNNLMILCSGDCYTHFYLKEGNYYVNAISKSAPILVPSNVYWHNKGNIMMLPNDMAHYSLVYLNKVVNVTIDGGSFIGDVKNHYGSAGEWGHGIKCGGASDIVLKNLSSNFHWGDGIDLIEGLDEHSNATINCNNITLENVKCLYNRRQGMSIEAAHNVTITDCEFAYTGIVKATLPSAGMDIEPWTNNNFKVSNITFRNCSIHDNKGFDLQCEPNIKVQSRNDDFYNNIVLDNCTIGNMRVQFTNGLNIDSSKFTDKLIIKYSQNIDVNKSIVAELEEGQGVINFKLSETEVNTSQDLTYIIAGMVISGFSLLGYRFLKH